MEPAAVVERAMSKSGNVIVNLDFMETVANVNRREKLEHKSLQLWKF